MTLASRVSGIAAAGGSLIGMLVAVGVGASPSEIYAGLWGYDPTLAAICVGGLFFQLSARDGVLAVVASVFCALLHGALRSMLLVFGITPLTFAAATTCFMFTAMGKHIPDVFVLPLELVSLPEEEMDIQPRSVKYMPSMLYCAHPHTPFILSLLRPATSNRPRSRSALIL